MGRVFSFGGLMYQDIEQLNRTTHAAFAVRHDAHIEMAQDLLTCPLMARELEVAALNYPIVFSNQPNPAPIALLATQPSDAPFVKDGKWAPKRYVPWAVWRYPFLLSKQLDDGTRNVMVDSDALVPAHQSPEKLLFDAQGEQTDYLSGKIKGVLAFQAAMTETASFMDLVSECDLLHECTLAVPGAPGNASTLGPFKAIERDRLMALPDPITTELHRTGVLSLLYAQVMSLAPYKR